MPDIQIKENTIVNSNFPDVFHVGFHKTASSFLQKAVFSAHPEIELRGTQKYFLNKELFNRGIGYYEQMFTKPFDEKKMIVESEEKLSGTIFNKGDRDEKAKVIKEYFPSSKVVLFIRSQLTMIESVYKQYLIEGGSLSFNDFYKSEQGCGSKEWLKYFDIINLYNDLFGVNFRVFIYENIVRDFDGTLNDLFNFIGVKPFLVKNEPMNRGATVFVSNFYRMLNFCSQKHPIIKDCCLKLRHVIDFADNNIVKHLYKKTYLSGEQKKFLWDFYEQDNLSLSNLINVDLSQYGYPMPKNK